MNYRIPLFTAAFLGLYEQAEADTKEVSPDTTTTVIVGQDFDGKRISNIYRAASASLQKSLVRDGYDLRMIRSRVTGYKANQTADVTRAVLCHELEKRKETLPSACSYTHVKQYTIEGEFAPVIQMSTQLIVQEINDLGKDVFRVDHVGPCKDAVIVKGKDGFYGDVVKKGYTLVVLDEGKERTPLKEVDKDLDGRVTIIEENIDDLYDRVDKHDKDIAKLQADVEKNTKDIKENTRRIEDLEKILLRWEKPEIIIVEKKYTLQRVPKAIIGAALGNTSLHDGVDVEYMHLTLYGKGEIRSRRLYGRLAGEVHLRHGEFDPQQEFTQFVGDLRISGGPRATSGRTDVIIGAVLGTGTTQTDTPLEKDFSSNRFNVGAELAIRSPYFILQGMALFGGVYDADADRALARYDVDLEANLTSWFQLGGFYEQARIGDHFEFVPKNEIRTRFGPSIGFRLPSTNAVLGGKFWMQEMVEGERMNKGLGAAVHVEGRF